MFRDRDGWRVQWRSAEGKRISKTFQNKADARLFESQLKAGVLKDPMGGSVTFGEFAKRWLEDYARVEKSEGTAIFDEAILRRHILPTWGMRRLATITKGQVLEFRNDLRRRVKKTGAPLAPKTLNHILALLKQILATAVEWEVLAANPAEYGVKLFPLEEQACDYWTSEERDRFLAFARHKDPEFTLAALLACHTGLRRGELAALERSQLNFDNRLILVNATWCYRTGQRLRRTKNRKVGWVPMNDVVYGALIEFKNASADTRVIGDPVRLLHAAKILRRLCKQLGLRGIRFHDLRHTFASTMAMAGVDPLMRQKLMRHRTAAMTDRYTHLEPEIYADAVAKIARKPARSDRKEDVKAENY